jgi:hypothetical protein
MKKLLYLMLIVLFIQCKDEAPKENCGIFTEMAAAPTTDSKSKPKTIPISYASCEYIAIVPQSKDSLILFQYLSDNKYVQVETSAFNPAVRRFSKGSSVSIDGTPPPVGPPPPPIKDWLRLNVKVYDGDKKPVSLFDILPRFVAPRIMVTK